MRCRCWRREKTLYRTFESKRQNWHGGIAELCIQNHFSSKTSLQSRSCLRKNAWAQTINGKGQREMCTKGPRARGECMFVYEKRSLCSRSATNVHETRSRLSAAAAGLVPRMRPEPKETTHGQRILDGNLLPGAAASIFETRFEQKCAILFERYCIVQHSEERRKNRRQFNGVNLEKGNPDEKKRRRLTRLA